MKIYDKYQNPLTKGDKSDILRLININFNKGKCKVSEQRRRTPSQASSSRVNSDQQKRIREIKRRKKQREMRRKRMMRLVMGIIALVVVIIAVAAIKGCNNAENEQLNANLATSPSPTPNTNREIDAEFYADTCFIGNGFIAGLENEDLVAGADYICDDTLDVSEALTEKSEGSSVVYINELNSNTNYKKIFMAFGAEELSWDDNDEFISEYENVIEKAKKYQPDSEIYLVSVTPVSEAAEEEVGYTNSDVEKLNKLIKELADDNDLIYCDIFDTLANSRGYLPDSASEDGINLDRSYYEKSLVYIQKNYTKEAIARAAEKTEDEEEEASSSGSSSNKSSSSSSSGNSSSSSSSSNKSSSSSSSSNSSSSNSSSNSSSSSNKSSSSSSNSSSGNSSSSSSRNSSSNSSSSSSSGSSSNNSSSSGSSNNSSSSSSSSNKSGSAVSMDLDDM